MNDTRLDDEIRSAFDWLIERMPSSDDQRTESLTAFPHRSSSRAWAPLLAAVAIVVLVGTPLLLRGLASDRGRQQAPEEFVTSIPEGEILLGSNADWQVFGFLTPEGTPCLRVAPLLDQSYCSSPEVWAIPRVLNWSGTWGSSRYGWVYGLTHSDVARIELEFPSGAVEQATLLPYDATVGWGAYIHRFDADQNGLFAVITAYDSQGVVLGRHDLRSECDSAPQLRIDDSRFDTLCQP